MNVTARAGHTPSHRITAIGTLSMIITLFALLAVSPPQRAYGSDAQKEKAPSMEFSEMKYDFGFAVDGQKIQHDFVLKNTGTAILEIQKVQTAWGCTAVSYPRQLPPGGEGKIRIKVDTTDRGGKPLLKKITVTTNAPGQEKTVLSINGKVDRVVTIAPRHVRLAGPLGLPISADVIISPEKKYSFRVLDVSAERGENIKVTFREMKRSDGTFRYVVNIWNSKEEKGRYRDKIIIKTDSKHRPEIAIRVTGNIV